MISLTPFLEDKSRWFLWWPVGNGIGISIYFSLPFEMSSFHVFLLFSLSLFTTMWILITWKNQYKTLIPAMALLSICVGFTTAKIRTNWLATPFLYTKVDDIHICGRIIDVEEQINRRRLTLDQLKFSEDVLQLHKIRLTFPLSKPLASTIGNRVCLRSSLLPLSDPVTIKSYHFRRQAYYQGIGATGRIIGPIHTIEKQNRLLWLSMMRLQLTHMIRQRIPGQNGEIAAALITGDRSGLHPDIRQAFTDAGLAHILAISGLHLTLVAGLIFLIFRRSLALFPPLVERFPIKKWSATLVMFATLGYLAISGFGIPGQRAFVMITIVMLGILLDRNPLSMRLVAIAAIVILTLRPESLLSASFQLSFAAVIGLIAAYEDGWTPLKQWAIDGGLTRRLIAYCAGLIATTLIATLATTPYTLGLFNRITLQSIVGNCLAIPLTSVVIMPAAMFSVLSLAIGGANVAFQILEFGLTQLIGIAQTVASWPGAAIMVPTPSPLFIIFMTFGGLWLCIWKNHWRWAGLCLCGLGCVSLYFNSPATIFAAGDGSVLAFRSKEFLFVSTLKRGQFFTDQWMKELGLTHKQEWAEDQKKVGPILLVRTVAHATYTNSRKITKDMCAQKALVTTQYARRICQKWGHIPPLLIDRDTLEKNGTYQIWVNGMSIDTQSVKQSLGNRPWSGTPNPSIDVRE